MRIGALPIATQLSQHPQFQADRNRLTSRDAGEPPIHHHFQPNAWRATDLRSDIVLETTQHLLPAGVVITEGMLEGEKPIDIQGQLFWRDRRHTGSTKLTSRQRSVAIRK